MTELEDVMTSAKHEILSLRRTNEILRAKVEMIDLFACVLHTQAASNSQGMSIDVAWQLEKELEKLKAINQDAATKG